MILDVGVWSSHLRTAFVSTMIASTYVYVPQRCSQHRHDEVTVNGSRSPEGTVDENNVTGNVASHHDHEHERVPGEVAR